MSLTCCCFFFFFSSRRRHTRFDCDWSSDVCSSDLADRLAQAGVVRSRAVFLGVVGLKGSMRRLKAGEYEIPREASTLDVVELLESGRVRQHVVLHPEGATVGELARALEGERLAPPDGV